jgi:AraC-like DNA-binding protein
MRGDRQRYHRSGAMALQQSSQHQLRVGNVEAAPLIARARVPRPPLSDFVALLWSYEGVTPPHAKERLLPTGTMELVINLRDDTLRVYDPQHHDRYQTYRGGLLSGVHSTFSVIDTADQGSIIGVHFKPGGAFPFFDLPADELHNAHIPLDALWGAQADDLRDRLREAPTLAVRFRLLEDCLLARATRPLTRHPAVTFALTRFCGSPHACTIADVTGRSGLGARRFTRIFAAEVGLTPKIFCRIRRFQRALRLIERGRRVDWAAVAASCGYFDQAHFIRDFRAFSGLNPTAYLRQRGEHFNHVPLHD